MDKNNIHKIDRKLNELINNGVLDNKKIYITPANDYTLYTIRKLAEMGYNTQFVLDSKEKLLGQKLNNIEIVSLEEALIPYKKNNLILLTDASDIYMSRKLDLLEYEYNNMRFWLTENEVSKKVLIKEFIKKNIYKKPLRDISKLYKAKSIYNRLSKISNYIYIFPFKSIGDIYILGLYRQSAAEKFNKDFTLVVVGEVCKKVALIMGFKKVISIDQNSMYILCKLKSLFNKEVSNMEVLHYDYYHTSIIFNVLEYNKINFSKCYSNVVFQEKLNTNFVLSFKNDNNIDQYCVDNKIIKGKTVILAPYAKSILDISIVFWENLALDLIDKGFIVFTNCGNDLELPITGTEKICFPLETAHSVVEYAGYFIGLRSGLCDFISNTKCLKVIIYPKWKGMNYKLIDFYSFNDMPYANNIVEYECDLVPYKMDVINVANFIYKNSEVRLCEK